MKNWTEALGAEIRSGAVRVVCAEVEYNPETGSKRPYELVKTLSDGRKFRDASFSNEAAAIKRAAECNKIYEEQGE